MKLFIIFAIVGVVIAVHKSTDKEDLFKPPAGSAVYKWNRPIRHPSFGEEAFIPPDKDIVFFQSNDELLEFYKPDRAFIVYNFKGPPHEHFMVIRVNWDDCYLAKSYDNKITLQIYMGAINGTKAPLGTIDTFDGTGPSLPENERMSILKACPHVNRLCSGRKIIPVIEVDETFGTYKGDTGFGAHVGGGDKIQWKHFNTISQVVSMKVRANHHERQNPNGRV